jgi:parallel beta-helix repeat protein
MNSGASTVTLTNTTLSGNSGTSGGGIYMLAGGSLTIHSSTLKDNVASTGGGGGVRIGAATFVLSNSTVSGNTAKTNGGGIRLGVAGGTLTAANSTITNNVATGGKGGGIYFTGSTNTVQFNSTIVAGNTGATNRDLSGSLANQNITGTKNLIGAYDSTIVTIDTTLGQLTNQFGSEGAPLDARLAPLANNGGATLTHGFRFDSPAIDMGNNLTPLMNDQRGAAREDGVAGVTDVGAVEGRLLVPFVDGTAGIMDVNTAGGTTYGVTVTFNDETGIDTTKLGMGEVTLTGPGGFFSTPATYVPGSSSAGPGNKYNAAYQFTPPGGSWDVLDVGTYSINLVASKLFDTDSPMPHTAIAATIGTFKIAIPGQISLVVDKIADVLDYNYTPGNVTLRNAIYLADNILGGIDTISFAPTLSGQTIVLTLGEIAISDGLTINGLGASKLAISGNNAGRVFNITDGSSATNMTVTINNLTITGGKNTSGIGGAIIQNGDTINFNNCILTGNSNTGNGGAIGMTRQAGPELPTINATNTIFSNNISSGSGGAIDGGAGNASITLTNCVMSGNSATGPGGGISAGYPTITMKGCTISGNTSQNGGGFAAYRPVVIVENSTISGNVAKASGGGFWFNNPTATSTLTIRNTTITANSAATIGGGIYRNGGTGITTIDSSIIAGNLNLTRPDFSYNTATTIAGDNDLIGAADVGNVSFSGMNIQSGTFAMPLDAKLNALADNGGSPVLPDGSHTKTHSLQALSPALNTGSNPATLAFDQRGNARSVGQTDIGAYEVQAPAKFSSVVINNGAVQRSQVTQVTVNFNQHVAFTGGAAAAFTLNRVSDSASVTLNAVVDDSGSGTAVTLTFTGGAVNGASLADGRYALHILASAFGAEGFDGNGDGTADGSPTDDYPFNEPAAPATLDPTKIFRIFGDVNGDGAVGTNDFVAFRQSFNGFNDIFDFDGDGFVSTSDFAQFRQRFNTSI